VQVQVQVQVNLLTMKCLGSRSRLARDLKWRWLGWVVRSRLMRNTAWVEVQVEMQVEAYEV